MSTSQQRMFQLTELKLQNVLSRLSRLCMICLLISAVWASPVHAIDNWSSVRAYMCRYTGTPPLIDGILDDTCWASADVATDFVPRGAERTEPATPQTAVRFCYDSSALYVAFECEALFR